MENNIGERVAVLEAKIHTVLDELAATQDSQANILTELHGINDSLTKYKGFVGGVAFVVTSIITFLSFAKEWVLTHLK
jgi:hypothetical protein